MSQAEVKARFAGYRRGHTSTGIDGHFSSWPGARFWQHGALVPCGGGAGKSETLYGVDSNTDEPLTIDLASTTTFRSLDGTAIDDVRVY